MDFFQKVTGFAKERIKEENERSSREKALMNLNKDQLLELAAENGISVSRADSKETIVYDISKCKDLTIKDIMKKTISKKEGKAVFNKKISKTIKEENVEVEQEITRTENIKTTVKRKTREVKFEAEVSKTLKNFDIVIRKDMKEKNIEEQLVQALRAIIPKEKVDYQQTNKRGRADIVIGKDIAIELKLITGQSQLMPLKGQLHSYSKEYDKLYVLLCDQNNILKPQTLDTFKKELKEMNIQNIEVYKKP